MLILSVWQNSRFFWSGCFVLFIFTQVVFKGKVSDAVSAEELTAAKAEGERCPRGQEPSAGSACNEMPFEFRQLDLIKRLCHVGLLLSLLDGTVLKSALDVTLFGAKILRCTHEKSALPLTCTC